MKGRSVGFDQLLEGQVPSKAFRKRLRNELCKVTDIRDATLKINTYQWLLRMQVGKETNNEDLDDMKKTLATLVKTRMSSRGYDELSLRGLIRRRSALFDRMELLRRYRENHNVAKTIPSRASLRLAKAVPSGDILLYGDCCDHFVKSFDERYKELASARSKEEFESMRRKEVSAMQKRFGDADDQMVGSWLENTTSKDLRTTMMVWADELTDEEVEVEVDLFMMTRISKDTKSKQIGEKRLSDHVRTSLATPTSPMSGDPEDVEALYDDVDPTRLKIGATMNAGKTVNRDDESKRSKVAEMKLKLQKAKRKLLDARQRQESTTSVNDTNQGMVPLSDITALHGPPLILKNVAESGPADLVEFIVIDTPWEERAKETPTLAIKKRKAAEVNRNIEILKRKLELKKKKKDQSSESKPASPTPPTLDKETLKKRQEEVKASMDAANWANLMVKQQNLLRDSEVQIESVTADLQGVEREMGDLKAQLEGCDRTVASFTAKECFLEDRIACVARELVRLRSLREEARSNVTPVTQSALTSLFNFPHASQSPHARADSEVLGGSDHENAKKEVQKLWRSVRRDDSQLPGDKDNSSDESWDVVLV